jgi:hypothetical protein
MPYCSNCGQRSRDDGAFCSSCGTAVSRAAPSFRNAAVSPTLTRTIAVEAKRGGRLGIIGFFIALILIYVLSTASSSTSGKAVGTVLAFGIGAAYIIATLLNWNRGRQVVRGEAVGWTIAVFLLLGCLGGLMRVGSTDQPSTATAGRASSPALFGNSPSKGNQSPKYPVTAVMDLPALALHTRAEVEKVLGKPSKYIYRRSKGELADEADYPWGSVGYNHSRFNFLIYKFQSKPDSYEKAFQLLKLPPPKSSLCKRGRRNSDLA